MTDAQAVDLLKLLVEYHKLPDAEIPSALLVAELAGDLIESTPRSMISETLREDLVYRGLAYASSSVWDQ